MSFGFAKVTERLPVCYLGETPPGGEKLTTYNWNTTGIKHNCHVIATVPKEDLLVWDLKEGWEPLCKFLNKPIPDQERKNNRVILELLIGFFELEFDWSI